LQGRQLFPEDSRLFPQRPFELLERNGGRHQNEAVERTVSGSDLKCAALRKKEVA